MQQQLFLVSAELQKLSSLVHNLATEDSAALQVESANLSAALSHKQNLGVKLDGKQVVSQLTKSSVESKVPGQGVQKGASSHGHDIAANFIAAQDGVGRTVTGDSVDAKTLVEFADISAPPGPLKTGNGSCAANIASVWATMQASSAMGAKPQVQRLQAKCSNAWGGEDTSALGRFDSAASQDRTYLDYFVIAPASRTRVLLDFLFAFITLYEAIYVPLLAFHPPATTVHIVWIWLQTIFWTFELGSCFFSGYHLNSNIETRFRNTARRYFFSWFWFDLIILMMDWICAVKIIASDEDSMTARLGTYVRWFRLADLFRFIKSQAKINAMVANVQSQLKLILIRIARITFFIMFATHVIACGWYAVGFFRSDWEDTWVKTTNILERSFAYKYMTSLHWSLSQFTGSSMDINPANAVERMYVVACVPIAILCFCTLISSFTNATLQVWDLDKDRQQQFAVLRQYVKENCIPLDLSSNVWGCVISAYEQYHNPRLHEKDVPVLEMLPRSLRAELQHFVFQPFLSVHPFWEYFSGTLHYLAIRRVYQNTIEEMCLATGQELFSAHEVSGKMYFVIEGLMTYTKAMDGKTVATKPSAHGITQMVQAGDWVSEPALWVSWKHCGWLTMRQHGEFLALDATKLHLLAKAEPVDFESAATYAQSFAKMLEHEEHSDVMKNDEELAEIRKIADEAFKAEEDATIQKNTRSTRFTIFRRGSAKDSRKTTQRKTMGILP